MIMPFSRPKGELGLAARLAGETRNSRYIVFNLLFRTHREGRVLSDSEQN